MTKRATGDLPDLSQCEQEPIHIPGAIQPHGVLLGIRPDTLTISQVSENVGDWLGLGPDEVLGRPLEEVAGAAAAEAIRAGGTSALRLIGPGGRALDGSVHRS
jgi:light-regulated signal transduction histidine kinase (bacteriophytochrome)